MRRTDDGFRGDRIGLPSVCALRMVDGLAATL
jgi:hypothetical protein